MWWVSHNEHGAFTARGIHGQVIYIDPKAEMVVVRLASHPRAANAALDPTLLPEYRALAKHLMARPNSDRAGAGARAGADDHPPRASRSTMRRTCTTPASALLSSMRCCGRASTLRCCPSISTLSSLKVWASARAR